MEEKGEERHSGWKAKKGPLEWHACRNRNNHSLQTQSAGEHTEQVHNLNLYYIRAEI